MDPRSAAEGQEVNSRNADELFPEHEGWHLPLFLLNSCRWLNLP